MYPRHGATDRPLQLSLRLAFSFYLLVCLLTHREAIAQADLTVTVMGSSSQQAVTGDVVTLQFNVTPYVGAGNIALSLDGIDLINGNPIMFLSVSEDRQSIYLNPAIPAHKGEYRLTATSGSEESMASIFLDVISPPGLQDVPVDVVEHERETAVFNCSATGNPTPTVEWIFNGTVIDINTGKYHIGGFGNGTYGSLTIYNLTYSDHGVYTCNASNAVRSLTVSAELFVQQYPVIVGDPEDTMAPAGGVARLNCNATGYPLPDIVWMKDGVAISQLNDDRFGAVTTPFEDKLLSHSVLTLNGPVLSDNGLYSCNATNELKTFEVITSAAAELCIEYPPSMTVNSKSITINQTDSVMLYCEGFGIPGPQLRWESSNNPSQTLQNTLTINIQPDAFVNGSDLTIITSTLQINDATRSDHEANFSCVGENGVENFIGTPELATTELIVQVPPTVLFPSPVPVLGLVKENVVLTFVIEDASPSVRAQNIEWTFVSSGGGSAPVGISEGGRYHFSMNDQSLTISDVAHSDEGDYRMMAVNEAGSDSLTITLNVEAAPEIVGFSNDTDVLEGNDIVLVCAATSEPTHAVQWLKDGLPITLTAKYSISNSSGTDEREVVSTLMVFNANMSDTGNYTCNVSNIHGSQTATTHVEVQIIPRIVQGPVSTIGLFANTSGLFCSAFGSPVPTIDWLMNGNVLDLSDPYIAFKSDQEAEFNTSSHLNFANLSFGNAGDYICRASNDLVSVQQTSSSIAILTVNHPPVVTNFLTSLVVNETQDVNLTCVMFGLPTPNVMWRRFDLAAIPADSSKFVTYTSSSSVPTGGMEGRSVLQVNAVNGSDTGNYTCTGVNQPLGLDTPTAIDSAVLDLLVQTYPRTGLISSELEIGVKGRNISLHVTVFGDEPKVIPGDIHWYFNGTELTEDNERVKFSDDRFSLTISNLSLSDEGNYSVSATNIIGTGTAVIYLNVQVSPLILETAGNVTQVLGRSAVFHCSAVSEPLHITSWLFNSAPVANNSKYLIQGQDTINSTLTVFNVSLNDEGSYSCNASNLHGVDVAAANLRVQVPPEISLHPPLQSILVTTNANLTCCVTGLPLPAISWIKGNLLLDDSLSEEKTFSQSSICSSLLLTNLSLPDTANYSCNASNVLAEVLFEVSTAALLTVLYPPEVFSLSMNEYVKNESDLFTVECVAFGVPLPQIFWIPSPLIDAGADQQQELIASTTRFDNVSSLCPTMPPPEESSGSGTEGAADGSGGGSGPNSNGTIGCASSSALGPANCSLAGALCPVACGINIENGEGVDGKNRTASVSRLTICSLEKEDELSYTCLAVNGVDNVIDTPEAAAANLIVQVPPDVFPANNQSQLAFKDRNTTLEFVIARASPDVEPGDVDWIVESERLGTINISSDDDSRYSFNLSRRSLTIVNLTINDTGKYILTATNPAGINSDFIDLDIQAFPDLQITSPPREVVTGETIQLPCFAEGSPLQNVRWEFTDVFDNLQYILEYNITDHDSDSGAQNITLAPSSDVSISSVEDQYMISPPDETTQLYGMLTIHNITAFQAGVYKCTLTNIYNTDSYSAPVDVQMYPRIVEGPDVNVRVCTAGGSCNLTCFAEGVPSPNMTWFHNGSPVSNTSLVKIITPPGSYSTRNSTLQFGETSLADAGNYVCRASNFLVHHENDTSLPALLTVHYPAEVVGKVESTIGNESSSASFTCIVDGIPCPSVSWSRFNNSGHLLTDIVNVSGKYDVVETVEHVAQGLVRVTSKLTVLNLNKTEDELLYRCKGSSNVTNLLGVQSTSEASLTVQVPPSVSAIPFEADFFTKGEDIQISFLIDRAFPSVNPSEITWIFDNVELDTSCLDCKARYNFSKGLLSLNITDIQVSDDGPFTLRAGNPAGYDEATINVTVYVPPAFNTTGMTITVNETDDAILSCTADGIPRPTIIWFRGSVRSRGEEQVEDHKAFREDLAAGQNGITSTLNISDTIPDDTAMYTCQASNAVDDVVLSPGFMLVVIEAFTDFCASSPCLHGGTCVNSGNSFKCSCGEFEGKAYGGDRCQEVITILSPPKITTPPERQVVDLDVEVTLHCEASGNPLPVISWFKDGVMLENEHENTLVFQVGLDDRGNYTCSAENSQGKDVSPPALVNVGNVVQYSSELIVPLSEFLEPIDNSSQLLELSQELIDSINREASGQDVGEYGNTTFYFIEIYGEPVNNGENVTIPILLTILASDRPDDELRQTVANSLEALNLGLGAFQDIGRYNYCPPDVTILPSPDGDTTLDFEIVWPETLIGEQENQPCPCGFSLEFSSLIARRRCGGDFGETGAVWLVPDVSPCEFSVLSRRICRLALINDTAERVTELRNITEEELGATEVTVTVAAIDSTVDDSRGNLTTTNISLDVIDNVAITNRTALLVSQRDGGTSTMLQRTLFNLTQSLTVDNPIDILKQTFAITLKSRQPNDLGNISSLSLDPTFPPASFSFPTDLNVGTEDRVTSFAAFADDALFLPRDTGLRFVSTSVLDFTISDVGEVSKLPNPVNLSFARSDVMVVNATLVKCVFWDPNLDDGFGNWSTSGCRLVGEMNTSANQFSCQCDHLTSFAVLLDVSPQPPPPTTAEAVFEIFTYIGLTISIISLCIVIFTYLYSAKLRHSDANKILLNLCFSLLGLYSVFLVAAQGAQSITEPVCAIVGALLQYFFLVNFFIMAGESVDLFIKLVIVLGPKIQHFVLKVMLLSWITPMFIVIFCIAPSYNNYISDTYCGAKGYPFYFGVLAPFVVVYIFNWTVFLAIMFSLIKKARNRLAKVKTKQRVAEVKQQLRIAMTVSVLFGLGWGFGLGASNAVSIEAIRYIFNIIFTILIAFQGFFVFLLYVLLSPIARNEWRRWILRKEPKKKGYLDTSSTGHTRRGPHSKRTTGMTSLQSGGTLHKQVLSSAAFKPAVGSSIAEYSAYESTVMSTHEAALQELRKKLELEEEEDDLVQTYMNPLDLGELISLKEEDDARSLVVETTFALPVSSPAQSLEEQEESEEEEDETVDSGPEAAKDHSEPVVSTFTNPFMRKSMRNPNRGTINPSEDSNRLSSPAHESDEEIDSGSSAPGNTSVCLDFSQLTASQGYTQSSFGEETVLIRENREITKL